MIFSGGAILLRTLRPGGVWRIQTILRQHLHHKLDPKGLSGDPVVSPRFVLPGTGGDQFMVLSADKTYLVNAITNKPVFIAGVSKHIPSR